MVLEARLTCVKICMAHISRMVRKKRLLARILRQSLMLFLLFSLWRFCIGSDLACSLFSVAPKLESEKKLEPSQQIKAGSNFSQQFTFYGVPTPTITWTVNGNPVSGSSYSTATDYTTLSLKGCVGKDSGTYEVTATNEVGKDSQSFKLVVIGK